MSQARGFTGSGAAAASVLATPAASTLGAGRAPARWQQEAARQAERLRGVALVSAWVDGVVAPDLRLRDGPLYGDCLSQLVSTPARAADAGDGERRPRPTPDARNRAAPREPRTAHASSEPGRATNERPYDPAAHSHTHAPRHPFAPPRPRRLADEAARTSGRTTRRPAPHGDAPGGDETTAPHHFENGGRHSGRPFSAVGQELAHAGSTPPPTAARRERRPDDWTSAGVEESTHEVPSASRFVAGDLPLEAERQLLTRSLRGPETTFATTASTFASAAFPFATTTTAQPSLHDAPLPNNGSFSRDTPAPHDASFRSFASALHDPTFPHDGSTLHDAPPPRDTLRHDTSFAQDARTDARSLRRAAPPPSLTSPRAAPHREQRARRRVAPPGRAAEAAMRRAWQGALAVRVARAIKRNGRPAEESGAADRTHASALWSQPLDGPRSPFVNATTQTRPTPPAASQDPVAHDANLQPDLVPGGPRDETTRRVPESHAEDDREGRAILDEQWSKPLDGQTATTELLARLVGTAHFAADGPTHSGAARSSRTEPSRPARAATRDRSEAQTFVVTGAGASGRQAAPFGVAHAPATFGKTRPDAVAPNDFAPSFAPSLAPNESASSFAPPLTHAPAPPLAPPLASHLAPSPAADGAGHAASSADFPALPPLLPSPARAAPAPPAVASAAAVQGARAEASAFDEDLDALADKIKRILDEEARRHGIDV